MFAVLSTPTRQTFSDAQLYVEQYDVSYRNEVLNCVFNIEKNGIKRDSLYPIH